MVSLIFGVLRVTYFPHYGFLEVFLFIFGFYRTFIIILYILGVPLLESVALCLQSV